MGHQVIAEATKASGEAMATEMSNIAAASREVEMSKIEVQLKLFAEQMAYQRKKDRRLYENLVIANDNARLAILKQGEVVQCLSHLSNVINMGMKGTTKPPSSGAEVQEPETSGQTAGARTGDDLPPASDIP